MPMSCTVFSASLHDESPLLTPVCEVVVASTDVVVRTSGESQDSSFKRRRSIIEKYIEGCLGLDGLSTAASICYTLVVT